MGSIYESRLVSAAADTKQRNEREGGAAAEREKRPGHHRVIPSFFFSLYFFSLSCSALDLLCTRGIKREIERENNSRGMVQGALRRSREEKSPLGSFASQSNQSRRDAQTGIKLVF